MLTSIEEPRYLPFTGEESMLSMGLSPLDSGCWIEPDSGLADYYRNKLERRRELADGVWQALPESAAAQRELHALLLAHLLQDHAEDYVLDGGRLRLPQLGLDWSIDADEALWQAGLWIQDDLCLLQESDRGYRLTAASLCAASYWRLEEKIGRPLGCIHRPVPEFGKDLGARVDRFFAYIKPERPVWRANWSVVASDALNQRRELTAPVAADAPLFLRVERQSLRRLPGSGAVVFTIRVYVHPLSALRNNAAAWRDLGRAIDGLTTAQRRYKGVDKVLPALKALGLSNGGPCRSP